jgi:uncharacterized RDD family membrane protein YckC
MQDDNPYSAPSARLVDAAPERDDVLAGRWLRLGGSFIDGMLLMLIVMPMMWFGGYFEGLMRGVQPDFAEQAFGAGVGFVVFVLVQGPPLQAGGQTWGKKALTMRIVGIDGQQPGLGRLLGLRYRTTQVINLVPFVGPLYGLVDSLMIFGEERRCLHDRIAGTRVVMTD